MKTIQKTMLIILLTASYSSVTMSQNLDSIPQAKRDSILVAVATEVILKYAPGYYREYKEPVITQSQASSEYGNKANYTVTFLYDETEERLECDYAAKVNFWENTGKPYSIMINGWERTVADNDAWRNSIIEQTPYQESLVPIYDINNPDPYQHPENMEELLRKHYLYTGNQQWIKTRPDMPPAQAVEALKRKGYKEKNGLWVKVRQDAKIDK